MLTTDDPLGGFSRSDWSAKDTLPMMNLGGEGREGRRGEEEKGKRRVTYFYTF